MKYAIETDSLSKKYKDQSVVDKLSLKVPEGSVYAFIGANGAGKTTTIKLLMNIIESTSGNSCVLGIDSKKLSPKELSQIGYVSENQEMPEWMKVREFLDYCKQMYEQWDDELCSALIEQFDLPIKSKISDLSRGMKVKASLISSLSYRPKLLVLDEPFTGLDALVREEMISGVLELTDQEKRTIFISSHDIDEMEKLVDWVGIIDQGQLQLSMRIEDLQANFRKVQINLDVEKTLEIVPEDWLLFKQKGRFVQFIDNQYKEESSESRYKEKFNCSIDIQKTEMSLKEIFVVYSKIYKMNNKNNEV